MSDLPGAGITGSCGPPVLDASTQDFCSHTLLTAEASLQFQNHMLLEGRIY